MFSSPRKMGAWWRVIALVAVLALVAVACGDDEAAETTAATATTAAAETTEGDVGQADDIQIWVVGSVLNNPFWDLIQQGAEAAGEDLNGATVTYVAPEEFSLANVNEFIKTAVAAEPDAILIDYRGREFEEITIQALDMGIEVQFYNNFEGADSSDARIRRLSRTAVGLNKAAAAARSAVLYLEFVNPGDKLVLFNSLPDSPEHLAIQNAYVDVFVDAGWDEADLDIVPLPGLDPAPNFEVIKSYLAANPDTAGIVTWDTTSGTPAAQAKADAGVDIPLVMWNIDQTVINGVRDGTIQLSLTQQPMLQTYYGVIAAFLKVKYGFIDPPVVDPGTLIITRDNVDEVEALFNAGIAG